MRRLDLWRFRYLTIGNEGNHQDLLPKEEEEEKQHRRDAAANATPLIQSDCRTRNMGKEEKNRETGRDTASLSSCWVEVWLIKAPSLFTFN